MSFWNRLRNNIAARVAVVVIAIGGGVRACGDDISRQFRPSTVDNVPLSTSAHPVPPRPVPFPDRVPPLRGEIPTPGPSPWPRQGPDLPPPPPVDIPPARMPDDRVSPHLEFPPPRSNPWLTEAPPLPPQWRDATDRFRREAGDRLRSVERILDQYDEPIGLAEGVLCLHLEHLAADARVPTRREYEEFVLDTLRTNPEQEVWDTLQELRDLAQNISEADHWQEVTSSLIVFAGCHVPIVQEWTPTREPRMHGPQHADTARLR